MKVKCDLFDQTINTLFRNELEKMSQNLKKSSMHHILKTLSRTHMCWGFLDVLRVFSFFMSFNPALAIQMWFVLCDKNITVFKHESRQLRFWFVAVRLLLTIQGASELLNWRYVQQLQHLPLKFSRTLCPIIQARCSILLQYHSFVAKITLLSKSPTWVTFCSPIQDHHIGRSKFKTTTIFFRAEYCCVEVCGVTKGSGGEAKDTWW